MSILTIEQAAKLIGFSKHFIYSHINEIPHYKVDHRLRFSDEKLLDWLESKAVDPQMAKNGNA